MRNKLPTLASIFAFSLLAGTLHAADEAYPVKLFQPDVVGSVEDVHYVLEQRSESTIALPSRDPQVATKVMKGDLTGRTETLAVDGAGLPTSIKLTVKKLLRADGRDMIKPGAVVEIHRTPAESTFKPGEGVVISDEAKAFLTLLFPKLSSAGSGDLVFGSVTPRKAGESWEINKDEAVKMMATQGTKVSARDIQGKTTLKAVEMVDGKPTLRVVSNLNAQNVALAEAPQLNGCEMKMTQTLLQPADPALPPLEMSMAMDMNMHMLNPSNQASAEIKVHVTMNFSGTVVVNPLAKATADAGSPQH